MNVMSTHTARDEIRLVGGAIEITLNLTADINKEFRRCHIDQVFEVEINLDLGMGEEAEPPVQGIQIATTEDDLAANPDTAVGHYEAQAVLDMVANPGSPTGISMKINLADEADTQDPIQQSDPSAQLQSNYA